MRFGEPASVVDLNKTIFRSDESDEAERASAYPLVAEADVELNGNRFRFGRCEVDVSEVVSIVANSAPSESAGVAGAICLGSQAWDRSTGPFLMGHMAKFDAGGWVKVQAFVDQMEGRDANLVVRTSIPMVEFEETFDS